MGPDVARNLTELSLKGALDLPTLTTVSLVLAGTLHTLKLNTRSCGAGHFRHLYAVHSALRGAFPALKELCLPARACLRGLEAFAGSALHTVRVMTNSPGFLRLSHVRSLLRLSQVRHLDLAGEGWGAYWDEDGDDHAREDLDADADADDDEGEGEDSPGGVEELALGDAPLMAALPGLNEEAVQELWALRRLLASAPPALESLWLDMIFEEINFVGGRITRAVMSDYYLLRQHSLRVAAAVLLPRLEATGHRLPLLQPPCRSGA